MAPLKEYFFLSLSSTVGVKSALNIGKMLNNPKGSALQYFTLIDDDCRADSCINCGECEFVCPQMLDIPQELEKVDEYFGREFNHF